MSKPLGAQDTMRAILDVTKGQHVAVELVRLDDGSEWWMAWRHGHGEPCGARTMPEALASLKERSEKLGKDIGA